MSGSSTKLTREEPDDEEESRSARTLCSSTRKNCRQPLCDGLELPVPQESSLVLYAWHRTRLMCRHDRTRVNYLHSLTPI